MENLMLVWIALAALIVLLDLWAMVSIFRSDKPVETKALWSLLLILFPILGLAIWGCSAHGASRRRPRPSTASSCCITQGARSRRMVERLASSWGKTRPLRKHSNRCSNTTPGRPLSSLRK